MVEDFYNRDFGESIADSKTEPSQEERRFMKRAEESLTLKDGHYEIAPPFKDLKCPIPNNRIQAEQRASWLKKKLEKIRISVRPLWFRCTICPYSQENSTRPLQDEIGLG